MTKYPGEMSGTGRDIQKGSKEYGAYGL